MTWSRSLLTPDAQPAGLTAPGPVSRRFDVYRNNVHSSLVQALRDGFPVIQRLVGEDFFTAMATDFIRRHPPHSPILAIYGADFPAFLASFRPVSHLPYLPDVARLELALRRAYHAADATPIQPDALTHPRLTEARLTLAPAVSVLTSPYPVYGIWRAHQSANAPRPTPGPEAVLITRPDWEPLAEPIPTAEAQFISHLQTTPLGQALTEGLDLSTALTRLLSRKAITHMEVPA